MPVSLFGERKNGHGHQFYGNQPPLCPAAFCGGLVFIIKGGDWFVDAATWIAEAFGIPKFIVGATVVSFATTLPEMLVSVFAALEGNADIAVGNAVGSVTANVGLIMCLSLVCMPCLMTRRQFGFKAGLLLATIAVLFAFTRNGQLSVLQSAVILLFFVAFLAESLIAGKREQGTEASEDRPELTAKPSSKTCSALCWARRPSCWARSCSSITVRRWHR